MEIKIECSCGTKFKFDVEPVNGRMPMPVACPACGMDATGQANEFLRSKEAASVSNVSAASYSSAPPPPAPGPGQGGGLRLNRPAPGPGQEPEPDVPAVESPPVVRVTAPKPFATESPAKKEKGPVMKTLSTVFMVLVIGFGLWRFGYKWIRRAQIVAAIATAAANDSSSDSAGAGEPKNLWYDDCVVLFIRHSNHLEVAEACQAYWKDKLHKNLIITATEQEYEHPGEYQLISAHNGYVRLLSGLDWPKAQFEGLARELSQKFGTLVFETCSEHFADTYHFGVYDSGARKFHAQMDIKMTKDEASEIVTADGNDWAIAQGYKPGPEGFKEFNLADADKITQRLGMKLWDEQDGTVLKGILLKEEAAAVRAR
jgi:hypothetical protein